MKALAIIGRILYAIPFIVFGLNHIVNAQQMASYVPIPGGIIWIYFTGVAFLAAGVSFIIGRLVHISGVLLAILLLTFVVLIHLPNLSSPEMKQMAFISLLKDTALAGAALYLAGTFYLEQKRLAAPKY